MATFLDLETTIYAGEPEDHCFPVVDDNIAQGETSEAPNGSSKYRIKQSVEDSIDSVSSEKTEAGERTYAEFRKGKYPLPNDLKEQQRLNLQHELFRITLEGRMFLAPITNPSSALDVAAGTGVWAIEFANLFPSTQVLGTDLSAIQPKELPKNCHFELHDAEEDWNFPEKFDYIHGRALLSCFTDPAAVLKRAYDSLTPGGYLELHDGKFPFQYIGEPPKDSAMYKWNETVMAGAAKAGRPWTGTPNYKRWMEELGFEDVVEKLYYWPTSGWAKGEYYKALAAYWQVNLVGGLEGISMKVMTGLGWKEDDVRIFLEEVRKDVKDTSIHAYLQIHVVYGRKPS
ncbi:S-adenosyl-L-methionine-dependent methyltransferase [Microthyrium microscopicum]|uniref:S-adenosyl-L-methionine-dependent methyltransferase n=1 Tax=Microthyrium microscopicum TaxID=703497 RepID=A0A6A6TTZ8_9PEZI|nr:S-adenosyl-L-methionine-dependent methyltransferase [Microthyrium microscopicum]